MPSEADIAREIGRDVDPDAIFARAHRLARSDRRCSSAPTLLETYRAHDDDAAPTRRTPPSAGRRALQERLPRPARGHGAGAAIALRRAQYRRRRQHDRPHGGARRRCRSHDVPERDARARRLLSSATATIRWSLDKWFALQAAIPEPATLDRVRALTAHPAFSIANPNRVRALIGTFAHGNQTQFNRADGAGYEFIADTVLALDPNEPAGRGAAAHRVQELARAGSRAGARRAEAALRRVAAQPKSVARRRRHRRSARSPTTESR